MTREEAIEALRANYPDKCYELLRNAVDIAIEALKAEPKRGKWIDDRVAFYRHCSECGANVRANLYEIFLDCDVRDLNCYPNCGAKMMDEVEE